jgi:glyoxylase-like metal-dependent hydrolase (beta-lactamase superfamily II)
MAPPNLTQVTRLRSINAFLVAEDDGLTLVDTLIGGSTKLILGHAEALGAPIVRIVLTHAHGDHIGSLDKLVATLGPGVEVLITARDAKLLAKVKTNEPGEPADAKIAPGGAPGAKTKPTRTIAPGDRIGSLEVIGSPGHSPGHISLLDTRDRTLIAGDAYATLRAVATAAKGAPRFPIPAAFTWHKPTALASARELRALDPARLAVGHGRTVEAPGPAMDVAIARAAASVRR